MRNYQEEFLCHYGVPGMKWGVRKKEFKSNYTKSYENRANRLTKKAAKYRKKTSRGSLHAVLGRAHEENGFKRLAQREYNRSDKKIDKWKDKASKYESKAKEASTVAKKSAAMDKAMADRRAKQSTGARLASKILNGPGTDRGYDAMRVAGYSRGASVITALLDNSYAGGYKARKRYLESH